MPQKKAQLCCIVVNIRLLGCSILQKMVDPLRKMCAFSGMSQIIGIVQTPIFLTEMSYTIKHKYTPLNTQTEIDRSGFAKKGYKV
jgi:hypothetical protein